MLALLESDQYSSSLKTVIEKGKEDEVLRALDQQIKRFDNNIRDLCTTFYQVFGTIEDLTPLKERVSSLKEQMSELGDRVREIRREFQVNSRVLQESWSVAHNSDIARSVLEQCLVLSLNGKREKMAVTELANLRHRQPDTPTYAALFTCKLLGKAKRA